MEVSVNKVTNANVYVNGASLLGKAQEITLPVLTSVMVEHETLGMVGKVEFFTGIDKMVARIKWNSYYPDVLKLAGDPFTAITMQVRSSMDTWVQGTRTSQKPVVITMKSTYKDFPGGDFKQQQNVGLENNLSVYYYKLNIDGQDIVEFDPLNNIMKVNGVDKLSTYRNNLGI